METKELMAFQLAMKQVLSEPNTFLKVLREMPDDLRPVKPEGEAVARSGAKSREATKAEATKASGGADSVYGV